jgi:hypothetical protein
MDRVPICQENRGTVEIAIMVEAGSVVREMRMREGRLHSMMNI